MSTILPLTNFTLYKWPVIRVKSIEHWMTKSKILLGNHISQSNDFKISIIT